MTTQSHILFEVATKDVSMALNIANDLCLFADENYEKEKTTFCMTDYSVFIIDSDKDFSAYNRDEYKDTFNKDICD